MLTDKPLFYNSKNYLTMVQEFQKFELSNIEDELYNLDKNAVDLLKKMLQKNPSSRISIKEILKHEFITRSQ